MFGAIPLLRFALSAVPWIVLGAPPVAPPPQLKLTCHGCHNTNQAKGGLDLATLPFQLTDHANRDRWIRE